jgi:type IV pilus assembly protein PilX
MTSIPNRSTQRGAALLVALILLVVITLVGLAAIGTTILQNKAAADQYDRQIAFQSAEAALRQAQVAITTATAGAGTPVSQTALSSAGFEDCSNVYNGTPTECLANPYEDSNVPAADIVAVPASAFSASAVAAGQPQYVVQYMGSFLAPTPKVRQIGGQAPYGAGSQGQMTDYYRVTARSADPSKVEGRAIVTLQSTFRN